MNEALSSALAGLQGQMRTLELLGSNIANINTVGYKASRMTFLEALGQVIDVEYTPFSQGDLEATGFATDLAIRGRSFFVVDTGEEAYYTRSGAFYFDSSGRLVNSDGYAVQGWMTNINGDAEVQTTANLENIVLDENLKAEAMPTENIWLTGNLSTSLTPRAQVWTAGFPFTTDGTLPATGTEDLNLLYEISGLVSGTDGIAVSGTTENGDPVGPPNQFIYGTDGTTLNDFVTWLDGLYASSDVELEDGKIVVSDTVAGESETSINLVAVNTSGTASISIPYFDETQEGFTGRVSTSVVVYDTLGESHNIVFEFIKSDNTTDENEWTWEATPSGDESISAGSTGRIIFNELGQVTSFLFDGGASRMSLSPGNGAGDMQLKLFVSGGEGFSGITQFNSVSTLNVREQDGRATGELTGYEILADGSIMGSFSNGVSLNLAQIAVAEFANPSALSKISGSNFIETIKSGHVKIGKADEFSSTVESGYLELSNVDIAEQFSAIIEAQRAFQASSRVLATLNQVIQESTKLGL